MERNDITVALHWFCSANIKFDLDKNLVARLAVSKTMTRADYSSLASSVNLSPPAVASGVGPINSKGKVSGVELSYEQPIFGNFGFAIERLFTFLALLFPAVSGATADRQPEPSDIPNQAKIVIRSGEFRLTATIPIVVAANDAEVKSSRACRFRLPWCEMESRCCRKRQSHRDRASTIFACDLRNDSRSPRSIPYGPWIGSIRRSANPRSHEPIVIDIPAGRLVPASLAGPGSGIRRAHGG